MSQSEHRPFPHRHPAGLPVTLLRLSLLAAAIALGNLALSWVMDRFEIHLWPGSLEQVNVAVAVAVLLYVMLMATPFVPGIEIGLILMVLLGARGVLLVYVGTLIALALAFGAGRVLPARVLTSLLRWLHLRRAESLVEGFCALEPRRRLDFLAQHAPDARCVPCLLKRRYLLLAVLFNLPGNALIGGGGGIALLAGASRLYSFPRYLLLISAAVLPVPILLLLSESIRG